MYYCDITSGLVKDQLFYFLVSGFVERLLGHVANMSFSLTPRNISELLSPKDVSVSNVQMKHLHAESAPVTGEAVLIVQCKNRRNV